MIIKTWDPPLTLYQYEALIRRLPQHHSAMGKIQADYKRERSGARGEKEVDFPLSFLSRHDYFMLHHLRIPDPNGHFQLDTLIINEKFMLILEIKNWYGTVLFGENGQVTRIGDDQKEEGFPNPILQAKLQKYRLQKWLNRYGLLNIPLHYFVVISFPSTIVKSASPKYPIPKEVIHNSNLTFKIQELDNVFTLPKINRAGMEKSAKQLCLEHVPKLVNLLEKYHISAAELVKGVLCPNCPQLPMTKTYGKWLCKRCNHISSDAYVEGLRDYQLLIDSYISNHETREFLLLYSPNVAKNLLKRLNLKSVGKTKGQRYELDFFGQMLN